MSVLEVSDSFNRVWSVYPYSKSPEYLEGDHVFVNLHSSAVDGEAVISGQGRVTEGPWSGRYCVLFDSDKTSAHVNRNRLSPRFPIQQFALHSSTIIMTSETNHYREIAMSSVHAGDYAVDIGCSTGMCTSKLFLKTKNVLGVDISDELLLKARNDFPLIRFEKVDVLENVDTFIKLAAGATVVFADIGGDREFTMMASVVKTVLTKLRPRLFVIKNREMVQHAAWYMGREVRKHKGHDGIKWSGKMEVLCKGHGWASINNFPWWAEGLVSAPDQWLRTWWPSLKEGTARLEETTANTDELA